MSDSRRRIIDITRPVFAGMPVWPGDAACRVALTARLEDGGGANVSELCMSAHTGTHADGAWHVLEDGARIGEAPLGAFIGRALLIDARGCGASMDARWLAAALGDASPERVLLRTGCWGDPHIFPDAFPALTPGAAEMLVERGARLVGTDAPSVDPFDSAELPAHRALLGAGTAILENLLLDHAAPGAYGLVALPLRLRDADASPVRAILLEP